MLGLQRSAGNAAVSRMLHGGAPALARKPEFSAETKREPDVAFTSLGDTTEFDVSVKNPRGAERGTKFAWDWGEFDERKLEKGAKPPEGPRAKLKAKGKAVGDAEVTPAVEITEPGGQSTLDYTSPASVVVEPPELEWQTFTMHGARAKGAERMSPGAGERMYVGDTLSITARFKGAADVSGSGIGLRADTLKGGSSGIKAGNGSWIGKDLAGWDVIAIAPGTAKVRVEMQVPGMPAPIRHEIEVGAVADPEFFKGRCATAETRMNELHAAGREWFMTAFENYQTGYKRHLDALEAQKAWDRLKSDLIWGVLFATVGGAAGGAIGGLMKNSQTLQKTLSKVGHESLTDAAKDLTKYVTRLPANARVRQRFGAEAAAGGGHTSGQHEGADPSDAGAPMGQANPAGEDPLRWMTKIDKKIAGERRTVGALLSGYQEAADQLLAYPQPENPFDFDPVETLERSATIDGKPITNLGAIPTADDYEHAFWITWVQTYAYKIQYYGSKAGGHAEIEENIGKELERAIDTIAKKFGTTGEAWIETYGGYKRRELEASIKKSKLLLQ